MSGVAASAFLPNRESGREVLVERKRVRERDDLLSWRRYWGLCGFVICTNRPIAWERERDTIGQRVMTTTVHGVVARALSRTTKPLQNLPNTILPCCFFVSSRTSRPISSISFFPLLQSSNSAAAAAVSRGAGSTSLSLRWLQTSCASNLGSTFFGKKAGGMTELINGSSQLLESFGLDRWQQVRWSGSLKAKGKPRGPLWRQRKGISKEAMQVVFDLKRAKGDWQKEQKVSGSIHFSDNTGLTLFGLLVLLPFLLCPLSLSAVNCLFSSEEGRISPSFSSSFRQQSSLTVHSSV